MMLSQKFLISSPNNPVPHPKSIIDPKEFVLLSSIIISVKILGILYSRLLTNELSNFRA